MLYDNLVKNIIDPDASYDIDKQMQKFYDLVKNDESVYKTVKGTFFDYAHNSQAVKITKALVRLN